MQSIVQNYGRRTDKEFAAIIRVCEKRVETIDWNVHKSLEPEAEIVLLQPLVQVEICNRSFFHDRFFAEIRQCAPRTLEVPVVQPVPHWPWSIRWNQRCRIKLALRDGLLGR